MPDLLGTFLARLDETGRFRLPMELAKLFGAEGALCYGEGNYLELYPQEEWQLLTGGYRKLQLPWPSDIAHQIVTRTGSYRQVFVKGKSRLTIPETHRDHVGMEPGKDIVIVGVLTHIQLWSVDEYEAEKKKADDRRLFRK